MVRLTALVIFALLLTGCAAIVPPQARKQTLPRDQIEFARAFDQYRITGDTGGLQQFKRLYPASLWAVRADTVVESAQQLQRDKKALKALRLREQCLRSDVEVLEQGKGELSMQLQELKKENEELSRKLEQLKGLLIQLEAQPK